MQRLNNTSILLLSLTYYIYIILILYVCTNQWWGRKILWLTVKSDTSDPQFYRYWRRHLYFISLPKEETPFGIRDEGTPIQRWQVLPCRHHRGRTPHRNAPPHCLHLPGWRRRKVSLQYPLLTRLRLKLLHIHTDTASGDRALRHL